MMEKNSAYFDSNESDNDELLTKKNIKIKEKYFDINEEDYEEPENYFDYDIMDINPKMSNNNINSNESKDNSNYLKNESKSKNLNIYSFDDKNNLIQNEIEPTIIKSLILRQKKDESNLNEYSNININNGERSEILILNQKNNDFKETNNKKEKEEEELEKDNHIINYIKKLKEAFPGLSSSVEYEKIYKLLENENCFELSIFEIMNIIQREVSIKMTENNSNNKKLFNENNNYAFNFPIELIDIVEPLYINNEHLKIIKFYKTMSLDEKNNFLIAKELTEDFFYINEKKEKRRKIIKFMDGRYNYIPILCKNYEKCDKKDCIYSHNIYEINYHPLIYKTKYEDNKDYCESNMALCPTAKNLDVDFRIIYNYKHKNIIDLMNILNKECNTRKRIKSIYKKIKKFDINTFKIFKCKKEKCEKDQHLCYYYHNNSEKRRHQYLYRYTNEKCLEKKNGKECKYGEFCSKCHTSNEFNYHKLNFGKYILCCREIKNGECIFIDTCYGFHDEKNEDRIKKKIKDKKNTDYEKLKKETKIDDFKCQNCKRITKGIIFYYLKCKHILCEKCYHKIKSDSICPLCGNSFKSEETIMINFKESTKDINELLTK